MLNREVIDYSFNIDALQNRMIVVATGDAPLPHFLFGASTGIIGCRSFNEISENFLDERDLVLYVTSTNETTMTALNNLVSQQPSEYTRFVIVSDLSTLLRILDDLNGELRIVAANSGLVLTEIPDDTNKLCNSAEAEHLLRAGWGLKKNQVESPKRVNESFQGLRPILKQKLLAELLPLYKRTNRFIPRKIRAKVMRLWGRI